MFTFPVAGSVADTVAISLSISENRPSSFMYISNLSKSVAGLRTDPSVYREGGLQVRIFAGNGSVGGDAPPAEVSPDPPPPHPVRGENKIMIDKITNRHLPDFAIMPSPNDTLGGQEAYHEDPVYISLVIRSIHP